MDSSTLTEESIDHYLMYRTGIIVAGDNAADVADLILPAKMVPKHLRAKGRTYAWKDCIDCCAVCIQIKKRKYAGSYSTCKGACQGTKVPVTMRSSTLPVIPLVLMISPFVEGCLQVNVPNEEVRCDFTDAMINKGLVLTCHLSSNIAADACIERRHALCEERIKEVNYYR